MIFHIFHMVKSTFSMVKSTFSMVKSTFSIWLNPPFPWWKIRVNSPFVKSPRWRLSPAKLRSSAMRRSEWEQFSINGIYYGNIYHKWLVGGLEHQFYFPRNIGFRLSSQLTFIFFRGVESTNQIYHKWEFIEISGEFIPISHNSYHKWALETMGDL